MKKLILILAAALITSTAWAGPPPWPMSEQQQYAYLASKAHTNAGNAISMCNDYFLAYLTWKDIDNLTEAVDALSMAADFLEEKEYYEGMMKITITEYGAAGIKQTANVEHDPMQARILSLMDVINQHIGD